MTKPENTGYEPNFSFLLNFSRGSDSRKKILKTLLPISKSCNQIAIELGLNWRTAYRHLQILEKDSLVKSFSFGQRKIYKLTIKGEEVIKILIESENVSTNVKKKNAQTEYCLDDTEKTIPRVN